MLQRVSNVLGKNTSLSMPHLLDELLSCLTTHCGGCSGDNSRHFGSCLSQGIAVTALRKQRGEPWCKCAVSPAAGAWLEPGSREPGLVASPWEGFLGCQQGSGALAVAQPGQPEACSHLQARGKQNHPQHQACAVFFFFQCLEIQEAICTAAGFSGQPSATNVSARFPLL